MSRELVYDNTAYKARMLAQKKMADELCARLFKTGHPDRLIAQKLKCTVDAVRKRRAKLGLRRNGEDGYNTHNKDSRNRKREREMLAARKAQYRAEAAAAQVEVIHRSVWDDQRCGGSPGVWI